LTFDNSHAAPRRFEEPKRAEMIVDELMEIEALFRLPLNAASPAAVWLRGLL
jgi:hypothetical protein